MVDATMDAADGMTDDPLAGFRGEGFEPWRGVLHPIFAFVAIVMAGRVCNILSWCRGGRLRFGITANLCRLESDRVRPLLVMNDNPDRLSPRAIKARAAEFVKRAMAVEMWCAVDNGDARDGVSIAYDILNEYAAIPGWPMRRNCYCPPDATSRPYAHKQAVQWLCDFIPKVGFAVAVSDCLAGFDGKATPYRIRSASGVLQHCHSGLS